MSPPRLGSRWPLPNTHLDHHQLLEWETGERDVQADARGRAQQQDTVGPRERGSFRNARLEHRHQIRDEGLFAAEAGQEREVDVRGLARFSPAKDREAADETELPPVRLAHRLQFSRIA
jgi:hypothetical protein